MHSAPVKFTRDSIIDLAKLVVKPLECDWADCSLILNSWSTLRQHQHWHCRKSRITDSEGQDHATFECKISKCSGRLHHSLDDLLAHIDMSHLVRVFLPCPKIGCNHDETLARCMALVSHFEDAHRDLVSQQAALHQSTYLQPLAQPSVPPRRPLIPLPVSPSSLLSLVRLPSHKRQLPQATTATGSTQPQSRKRNWTFLNQDLDEEDSSEKPEVPFKDLPPLPNSSTAVIITPAMIQPRPVSIGNSELSAPPPSKLFKTLPDSDSGIPLSMTYRAFSSRYEELEKYGVVTGDGIWPDLAKRSADKATSAASASRADAK